MELLKSQAQLDIVHVAYRGFPPVVQDLLPGQIHATFAIIPAVLPHIKAGKLKALALTSAKRSELAPEVPTIAEQGFPQFDATAWIGLLAPARIPPAVADKIAQDTRRSMQLPQIRQMLGAQGFEVVGSTPEEFVRFIRAETEKWGSIAKATGAKAE
jgi:tripartite-type tricarboxylate transporter receptor subunit TctC